MVDGKKGLFLEDIEVEMELPERNEIPDWKAIIKDKVSLLVHHNKKRGGKGASNTNNGIYYGRGGGSGYYDGWYDDFESSNLSEIVIYPPYSWFYNDWKEYVENNVVVNDKDMIITARKVDGKGNISYHTMDSTEWYSFKYNLDPEHHKKFADKLKKEFNMKDLKAATKTTNQK